MVSIGLKATCADKELYVKSANGVLILLLSTHVDDLKFCGTEVEVKALVKALEEQFEKMKLGTSNFEHLGIKHSQNELDFSITLGQAHYAAQLREIAMDTVNRSDSEAAVSTELHVAFRSLLGAVAWMTQTGADIIVYVAALQRIMAEPHNKHVIALNKVLKYIKRKPLTVTYKAVRTELSSQKTRTVWP